MGYADFWTKNAVTYVSPAMNGFTVHLQHGMSNTAGRTGDGTMMAAVAVYSKGPLNASAGYEKIDGGLTAVEVAATSGVSTVVAAPAVGKKEAQYINARYAMGPITLGAGFFQVKGAIANTAATTSTRDGSSVHARYDFSKQASASLSYNDFEGTKVTTLQARYVLSPRTSLYGLMNSIDNGKVTTFVPTWGARANPRPGNNQTALSAGVIHAF
jgi:predicted porin